MRHPTPRPSPDAPRAKPRTGARLLRGTLAAVLAAGFLAAAHAQVGPSDLVIRGQDNWLFAGWGSLTDVDTAGIAASTDLIKQAAEALAKAGVRLEVVVLPDKALFYGQHLPPGKSVSPAVAGRYDAIRKSLTGAGVATIDVRAVLADLQKAGGTVFHRTDQHWTLAAAEATAAATARHIQETAGTLAGSAGTGQALGSLVNERRYGDLAERFLTPEERRQAGRETFTVRRHAADGSLIDDDAAPVHVSGHSMVQPYFGFPQKLSNALDRPVSLNWQPGNVGHWAVLLEYLESPAFRANKPQVLVWQLFEPTYAQAPAAAGLWDNASIMSADTWLERVKAATAR